jgi:hypothetical protein
MIAGLVVAIIGLAGSALWDVRYGILMAFFYSVPMTLFGTIFFGLSRRLSSWVCFDFDRFDNA